MVKYRQFRRASEVWQQTDVLYQNPILVKIIPAENPHQALPEFDLLGSEALV